MVLEEEAYQYAVSQQVGFFECSAKNFVNVNELFSGVVRLIERQRNADAPAASASSAGGNGAGHGAAGGEGGDEQGNGTPQRGGFIKRCVIL